MESLQQTAARVLGPLLHAQPLTAGKVTFAWSVAAGPLLARHGTPHWHHDGTLYVHARELVWVKELERSRPIVAERLAHLLGPGVVRRIVISKSELSHA
jgi:predicted nucleic acid-binding Zn ribbon protein